MDGLEVQYFLANTQTLWEKKSIEEVNKKVEILPGFLSLTLIGQSISEVNFALR